MGDEKFYKKVEDELNRKPKYTDRALWSKAEVLCKGDEKLTRYKYIELRVEKLVEKEKTRKEMQEQLELEKLYDLKDKAAIEEEKKEEEKKENHKTWVIWLTFALAFIVGRVFGLLGIGAVVAGYYAYDYFYKKDNSMPVSIILGCCAGLIAYGLGLYILLPMLD